MAQKVQKTQATRNTATLNRTHLISLLIYLLFLLTSTLLSPRNLLPFLLLNLPALAIEFWFERIGRPTYTSPSPSTSNNGRDLRKAGEPLDAKGLTEWMWDIVYWSWGNTVLVAVVGLGVVAVCCGAVVLDVAGSVYVCWGEAGV
ncbi:hypothetical protein LTS02_017181 [Friedmanniomyces endolithicus]|nr:hypothetical protein LTS02_017181 [Friedmanniomyces endolithicus]